VSDVGLRMAARSEKKKKKGHAVEKEGEVKALALYDDIRANRKDDNEMSCSNDEGGKSEKEHVLRPPKKGHKRLPFSPN